MTNKEIINLYIPLVSFLGNVLGKNSEIVLHDVTNPDASIVAIANAHVTNRKIGGKLTDFALKIIKENKANEVPFLSNYSGVGKANKTLRSSTFFIKNANSELIGLLCVNSDDSLLKEALDNIQNLLTFTTNTDSVDNDIDEIKENFSITVEDMATNTINEFISNKGIAIDYLKQEDKLQIIEILYRKGFFMLKGAVTTASDQMKVSEASIYRYIHNIKKNTGN